VAARLPAACGDGSRTEGERSSTARRPPDVAKKDGRIMAVLMCVYVCMCVCVYVCAFVCDLAKRCGIIVAVCVCVCVSMVERKV
jgi:hypothetical protein